MDGLPTELLLESLSLLTVPAITIVSNINKLFRELTEEKWLIRQFPHCQINSKLVFRDKLVKLDIKTDITNQLIKISQDSYQSGEQLLWCLVQYISRSAARVATGGASRDAARVASWYAACDAAKDVTRSAAWNAARVAAWNAACDASWYAACDASWYAAWDAVCDVAQDAVCDAVCDAVRDAVRGAVWTAINKHQITDLKLIGQLAYITAERTILIKLPEIVKSCRAILTEKIPNYREINVDLKIPTDTTNPFFLQYRKLFVT